MCGRVTLELDIETIREMLKIEFNISEDHIHDFRPHNNICPSEKLISVIENKGIYRAGQLTWGFIPSWVKTKEKAKPLINARSETLDEKPAFSDAYSNRRCIIFTSGFYEWDKVNGTKDKYIFKENSHDWMALAGIWNKSNMDGNISYNCSILTTRANKIMEPIHHRMPVILDGKGMTMWLDSNLSHRDRKVLFDMSAKDLFVERM